MTTALRIPTARAATAAALVLALLSAPSARAADKVRPPEPAAPAARAAGCSEDGLEPDDTCGAAATVAIGVYPTLVSFSGNDDWYKITVQRGATIDVALAFTNSFGDIDMALVDGCGATLAVSAGTGNAEHIAYTNTGVGRTFSIRVYLYSGFCNTYSMHIQLLGTDNLAGGDVAGGWAGPLVPRNAAGAAPNNVPLTATLDGNSADTYLNWLAHLTGPNNSPPWSTAVYIDDIFAGAGGVGDNSAPNFYAAIDVGPYTVRGGRHSLMSFADVNGEMIETNEFDNIYSGQWVWSPLVTSFEVPNVRSIPPGQGTGTYPNSDGFRYSKLGGYAWLVSEAGQVALDDYDLLVYDNYTGSTSGFSNLIGSSTLGSNFTDFVVGHYTAPGSTSYSAVIRYVNNGTSSDFAIDQSDGRFRNGSLVANSLVSWPGQVLAANRLADVYEAYMNGGVTYYLSLRRTAGTTPIQFEAFPGTPAIVWARGGGTTSSPIGDVQTLAFSSVETGWHPIVVYRNTGTGSGTPLTYDFEWSTTNFVAVPGSSEGGSLQFAGVRPNPVRGGNSRFEFVLPAAGRASLTLYDLGGRRVRVVSDESYGAGPQSVAWDGRLEDGAPAGAGIYWARLEAAGRVIARRVAVLH